MSHNNQSGSAKNNKRRHVDSTHSDEELNISPDISEDSWPRFIVIASADGNPLRLNPFAISLGIKGACGEVQNVTRLRSGSLLVECARRQQSVNLLSLQQFVNTEVVVSVHKTLNSKKGIIRDRARCLADMSEEEIAIELKSQGVTDVKRFTRKKQDGTITQTNTYLFTFSLSVLPTSIKAGYFNIGVEVYVPNPLRCFKCQQFGHGAKYCRNNAACFRCGGAHDSSECTNTINCVNCSGGHMASSKFCPKFEYETKILKIKCNNNISYHEAKKLIPLPSQTPLAKSYSAAASSPSPTKTSVQCQTSISWVTDQQIIPDPIIALPGTSTSETQTDVLPSAPDTPDALKQIENVEGTAHLTNKEKKQLKKRARALQHLGVPSHTSNPVEVHNSFEPLEMEVTPSNSIPGSGPPSRSRSPVEPP
ncbi:uncharacterized protein LOC124119567 [Haliotis rufescens]|uniref:uncharacterized protein LOC124119567 n=1 Tax=Haliotis rufescens TaxID=6454 RepID=UPI00201F8A8B|nr:uncharacterized protein LOC124119567 [Haliotis rufescens]